MITQERAFYAESVSPRAGTPRVANERVTSLFGIPPSAGTTMVTQERSFHAENIPPRARVAQDGKQGCVGRAQAFRHAWECPPSSMDEPEWRCEGIFRNERENSHCDVGATIPRREYARCAGVSSVINGRDGRQHTRVFRRTRENSHVDAGATVPRREYSRRAGTTQG